MDDIVLFAKTAKELEQMLTELSQYNQVGLTMNKIKTKLMTNSKEIQISGGKYQHPLCQ